ncbi:MAG TPA: hypothetical protein PK993_02505 [Clostridia bacterium]|nr:hypothetical protein [Clostridia bacterium]
MIRSIIYAFDVYIKESNSYEAKLIETFTARTIEDLITFTNNVSNYITISKADLTPEVF